MRSYSVLEMISCPSYIGGIIRSNPSNRGGGDTKARLKTCAGRPTIAISSGNSGVTCIKYSTARTRILHAACFSRWNTRPSVASVVVSRIKPHSLPPLFHSEFSLLENRAENLPSPPPLILKLQIERDIRVLFRRMSRWKRSRRFATSTPTTAALLPASIVRLDQPSTRVEPNPTPKIRRVTRQQPGWVLGARGISPSPPHPFHPRFPSSLSTFPSPLSSPHSPPLSRFPAFLRQRRYYYYSPTSLWSVSPPSFSPPPYSLFPFLCNLPAAFASLFTPLLPLPSSGSTSSGGDAATLPFSNKHKFGN